MGAAPAAGRAAAPKPPAPLTRMSWERALGKLKAGKSLSFVEVTDPIDVHGSFTWPFECTACLFDKGFHARDAVFTRVVDLRGTTFMGDVDMQGATFEGPVLFVPFPDVRFRTADCANRHRRHPEQPCSIVANFQAPASFSLATFEDVGDFESVTFELPVDFSLARFQNEADFSKTTFSGDASFRNARFTGAASFLGANFQKLQFDYVRSSGSLDFSSAVFACTRSNASCQGKATDVVPDALFDYSVVGELAFTQTTFDPGVRLSMAVLQATDLVLAPADVRYVAVGDRERILGLIETGAKSTNDLGVANEAHYRLQASRSTRYPWPVHALDFAFYRSIAGYLVEPLQPLLTLLALALLVSFLRALLPAPRRRRLKVRVQVAWRQRSLGAARSHAKRLGPRRKRVPGAVAAGWSSVRLYLHQLLDTLLLMWPGSGASQAGRRVEANVYRILFVCMLIGFANSNPTLRQMFDALR
jgi:uncharacterized protein YjbI with pentapeptide repeats